MAADTVWYMPHKLLTWRDKEAVVNNVLNSRTEARKSVNNYLKQKFANDNAYYENKQHELEKIANGDLNDLSCVELYLRLIELLKRAGVHRHQYQEQLKELNLRLEELLRKQRGEMKI